MILDLTIAALAVLVIARAPTAILRPSARPAWLASALGTLGLLSIGVLIPIPVADSWLGGENWLFLLRTLFPVAAFWFFRDAIALRSARTERRGRLWGLAALLLGQATTFSAIPRYGPTSITFVDDHVGTVAGLAWAVVYVGGVLWIAIDMLVLLAPRRNALFRVFMVGAASIVGGAIALLAHCTLIFAGVVEPRSQNPAWILFNVLFYPGIAVLVGAFLAVTIRDAVLAMRWRILALCLARLAAARRGASFLHAAKCAARAAVSHEPMHDAYEAAIQLRDMDFDSRTSDLSPLDRTFLDYVEVLLSSATAR